MEEVAVGLIGYGLAGAAFHGPIIRATPRLRLAAIASSRAGQIANDFPGVRNPGSPGQLITDPDVDLVVIATPNATHFELARMALLAGKHTVVDKPFSTSSAEAAALINLAIEQGLLLSVYQNR